MSARARHHGMDWLRIGAFALLILYHVGLAFGPWSFEIKVAAPADWVAIPLLATNAWRLALLFVVSGYATSALRERSTDDGRFLRRRLARLGPPLLFGMAVLNTPQPWITLVTQHGYARGFGDFLAHDYYRFQVIDGIAMPTWMHLWFVVYLVVYTIVLAALAAVFEGRGPAVVRTLERLLAGPRLILVPLLWIVVVRRSLPPGWVETHALTNDWSAHAVYLPAFLFGVALRRSGPLMATIVRQWKVAGVLALVAYGGVVAGELIWPGNTPLPAAWRLPYDGLRATQCWCTIVALVGIADRFLDVDHRWRPVLSEAVFPFYVIHQTIILVVGYWLLPTETGALVRFVALVAATVVGCWSFHALGRRSGPLRPWLGLAPTGPRAGLARVAKDIP